MNAIRVIQYGLGPIGAGIARLVIQREGLWLVGAVDIDPSKAGRKLGHVIGLEAALDLEVQSRLDEVVVASEADIVVHSTGSSLPAVYAQLEEIVGAKLNVVSTCEELAYPAAQHLELADRLQDLAEREGVTILGTGINPGYAMDALGLFFSAACQHVERISITRRVDAGTRRLPLQKKIGAGLTVDEFKRLVDAKTVRHVGLMESVFMLAAGLGWTLDAYDEDIQPIIAEKALESAHVRVRSGDVAGVRQRARGFVGGREVIVLDLEMSLGVEDAGDFVEITGQPDMSVAARGIHGDLATAAVVVNCIPRVVEARPGLLTMKDAALPSCWSSMVKV